LSIVIHREKETPFQGEKMQMRPQSRYASQSKFDSDFDRPLLSRIPIFVRIAVISIFALTIAMIGFSVFAASSVSSVANGCTVTDKDRTSDGQGGSNMRIYTKGCNGSSKVTVFTVADNHFVGQYASADTYAGIEIGKTYNLEARGVRIPVINMFENIVSFTEVAR
jgi:hypothetical protein